MRSEDLPFFAHGQNDLASGFLTGAWSNALETALLTAPV